MHHGLFDNPPDHAEQPDAVASFLGIGERPAIGAAMCQGQPGARSLAAYH
jgi:hypothetical protein